MWRCPNCNTENNNRFCAACGTRKPDEISSQRNPEEELEKVKQSNNQLRNRLIIVSVIAASLLVIIFSFSVIRGIFYQNQKKEKAKYDVITETEDLYIPTQVPIAPPTSTPQPTPQPLVHYSDVREITNISSAQTYFGDIVTIQTTTRSTPQVQYMHDPERIVIDFPGFTQIIGGAKIGYSGNCFSDVRYANHDSYARVVIDLYAETYYTVDTYDNKCVVEITK